MPFFRIIDVLVQGSYCMSASQLNAGGHYFPKNREILNAVDIAISDERRIMYYTHKSWLNHESLRHGVARGFLIIDLVGKLTLQILIIAVKEEFFALGAARY